jgi:hypothetical protein
MNRNLLRSLDEAISRFEAGEATLADLKSSLSANAQALDRSVGDDLINELRRLDAALDSIEFTVSENEKRNAVLAELSFAQQLIRARLSEPEAGASL